eukprot:3344800-Prymnesium_polylepis.1
MRVPLAPQPPPPDCNPTTAPNRRTWHGAPLFLSSAAPVWSIVASLTATSLEEMSSAAARWPSARTRSASASPRALSTSA